MQPHSVFAFLLFFNIFIFSSFLLFSITTSIYHSIKYNYLLTYVNLPMCIFRTIYIKTPTYLCQSTYPCNLHQQNCLPISTYLCLLTNTYQPVNLPSSTYLYKCLNIGIVLAVVLLDFLFGLCIICSHHHANPYFFKKIYLDLLFLFFINVYLPAYLPIATY